jgi:hypothetical protein
MKPLKEKVSITLDNDIICQIKQLSEKEERSFSQYINLVLRAHLNRMKKTNTPRD